MAAFTRSEIALFNSNSKMSFYISLTGTSPMYQSMVLTSRIESKLRKVMNEKSIRTKNYPINELGFGAGPSDILSWIVAFYENHSIYFSLLTKLPFVRKSLKFMVTKFANLCSKILFKIQTRGRSNFFYARKDHKISVEVRIRVDIDTSNYVGDEYQFEQLKLTLLEVLNLRGVIKDTVVALHPEADIVLALVAKSTESLKGIAVHNVYDEKSERISAKKLVSLRENANTYVLYFYRTKFLKMRKVKILPNYAVA